MTNGNLSALAPADVRAMDYNQLIGIVRETNRPPGGIKTIALLARQAFLDRHSHVLEIGTSTGITAIELARLVGCQITAIDINEESLAEARRRADEEGVGHLISFECRDATDTRYGTDAFDMVFCGNVTSLIPDRGGALAEYQRVLKTHGFLAAVPMYYVDEPSEQLLADVSEAIQVQIQPHDRAFWMEMFHNGQLREYWSQDFRFDRVEDSVVDGFVDDILERPHLAELSDDSAAVLAERYRAHMHLFKINLAHMGFTALLLRKEPDSVEPELFTSRLLPA